MYVKVLALKSCWTVFFLFRNKSWRIQFRAEQISFCMFGSNLLSELLKTTAQCTKRPACYNHKRHGQKHGDRVLSPFRCLIWTWTGALEPYLHDFTRRTWLADWVIAWRSRAAGVRNKTFGLCAGLALIINPTIIMLSRGTLISKYHPGGNWGLISPWVNKGPGHCCCWSSDSLCRGLISAAGHHPDPETQPHVSTCAPSLPPCLLSWEERPTTDDDMTYLYPHRAAWWTFRGSLIEFEHWELEVCSFTHVSALIVIYRAEGTKVVYHVSQGCSLCLILFVMFLDRA